MSGERSQLVRQMPVCGPSADSLTLLTTTVFAQRKLKAEGAMTALYARLDRASPYVLSILRIITGLLFLQHGLQKYFHFPSAPNYPMWWLIYVQGIIEIVGSVLLAGGLYTRIVAFILSGDMAVAYFMVNFPRSFYPLANGGELAVLYCFVFFYIFFAGGGPWSLDRIVLRQDWGGWQEKRAAE
jgi:putative oxidoreductase